MYMNISIYIYKRSYIYVPASTAHCSGKLDATALSCTRMSRFVSFAFDCVARYVSAIYIRYLCTYMCRYVCRCMKATQSAKCIYAMLHISAHIASICICKFVMLCVVCCCTLLLQAILRHCTEYSYTVV